MTLIYLECSSMVRTVIWVYWFRLYETLTFGDKITFDIYSLVRWVYWACVVVFIREREVEIEGE